MPGRKDALAAAAELVLALESAAKSTGAIDTVGTVGVCDVFPGAVNSIPSRVRLETDIRDIDISRRDDVIAALRSACDEVQERRGVKINSELVNADPPATCDAVYPVTRRNQSPSRRVCLRRVDRSGSPRAGANSRAVSNLVGYLKFQGALRFSFGSSRCMLSHNP